MKKIIYFLLLGSFLFSLNGCGNNSNPELIAAVNRGDLKSVEKMLNDGANPDSTSLDGRESALNVALKRADVPMTELLLIRNASPKKIGKISTIPFHMATSSPGNTGRQILLIRALVNAKADINEKDSMGRTPIFNLVTKVYSNFPVIEEMIRLGADPTIKNSKGVTAIDLAIENNVSETTIEYMRNYKENKGKSLTKFGNTEGMCKIIEINKEKDLEGLKGLYFSKNKECDENNLASGIGEFTKYNGTVCSTRWKTGSSKDVDCRVGY